MSLADVTARWKTTSPQERLRRRGDLLRVADFLKTAALVLDRDRDLALDRDVARARDRDLARARDRDLALALARDRDHVSDLVRDLTLARALGRALGRNLPRGFNLDGARDLVRDLDYALDCARRVPRIRVRYLVPISVRDFICNLNARRTGCYTYTLNADERVRYLVVRRDRARDFIHDVDPVRDSIRDLARDLARILDPARDPASSLARVRDLVRPPDLARNPDPDHDPVQAHDLARDCIKAHGNLTDAATNFVGADLTAVDLVEIDLAGIRWDSNTRWPTPEWTARIRRTSIEDPPGSGVFIVQPEEGHDFAERGSLVPIW
ncbi:hypothetical protein [Streptomyces sp. IB201691-2A2]|uniref:hypothetical protein n=1 Tax=Streptomyces sp. IB201691-2A2 TaxID=2561920 RepID=UPI00163DE05E|nr:hypothetical protein [Streptomyces sp. IB201691-2A2]